MTKKVEKLELTYLQQTVDRFMVNYGEKGHSLILSELAARIAHTDQTSTLNFFLCDASLIISYCIQERVKQKIRKGGD